MAKIGPIAEGFPRQGHSARLWLVRPGEELLNGRGILRFGANFFRTGRIGFARLRVCGRFNLEKRDWSRHKDLKLISPKAPSDHNGAVAVHRYYRSDY